VNFEKQEHNGHYMHYSTVRCFLLFLLLAYINSDQMTIHKTTRTECDTDQPSIQLIFWPIVSILHAHSLLTPSTMARGTNAPCWNSSSAHGKALEALITELHHDGQLIDGETSFQEVLDGVPELAMYSRDALRRAAKVIAARALISP
jgi:hypothetical protein